VSAGPTVLGSVPIFVLGIGWPEAVVADALKALGQHMQQEATDKLFGLQCHRLLLGFMTVILVTELHFALGYVYLTDDYWRSLPDEYSARRSPIPARVQRKGAWRRPPSFDGFALVDKTGNISKPADFRDQYQLLGAWWVVDPTGNQMHVTYASPGAAEYYRKNGKFADGTVMVKEILKTDHAQMTSRNR
jgi:Cytochrome P460